MFTEGKYKIIDSHAHAGLEKKDIEKRAGCLYFWLGSSLAAQGLMGLREKIGESDPYKILTKAEEIPDYSVEHWIKFMDEAGVSHIVLQCMNTQSDPPSNWKWHVPNRYVKEEFVTKYPDRFIAIGGVNFRMGPEVSLDQVEEAKELGFPGIKIHTPTGGYPHDREKCYPIYEKCLELGLHVEIHTGVEELPGTRKKYQDPVFIDDIAVDFTDLKILQLHCGMFYNPMLALSNVFTHPNVYTDITVPVPSWMAFRYHWDLEHMRFMEFFIPDKVFFGSDVGPSHTIYGSMIDHIQNLPLSEDFKRKLFLENAKKFFNIED
jgi:predicted TIM-barrel fold metal-dependent hydrolase